MWLTVLHSSSCLLCSIMIVFFFSFMKSSYLHDDDDDDDGNINYQYLGECHSLYNSVWELTSKSQILVCEFDACKSSTFRHEK